MGENYVKELVERFGVPQALAEDAVASRNEEEMQIVISFLKRYGMFINRINAPYVPNEEE